MWGSYKERARFPIKLILSYRNKNQFFYDTLRDFERTILESRDVTPAFRDKPITHYLGQSNYNIYRALTLAFGIERLLPLPVIPGSQNHYMVVLMGIHLRQCLPYFSIAKRKSIYLFDAWESAHPMIQSFVQHFSVDDVFFSSWQVTEKFRRIDRSHRYHWIPEGVDPNQYKQVDYAEKNIDVLQIGRKDDAYHDQIVGPLQNMGVKYLYEKTRGQIIFPTREDFTIGLARSRISICVPSNITHPERSGSISTMTNRYLQSMISKCLIVGIKPIEMDMLFDHNPMIEIDRCDPVGQICDILKNYEKYVPLIEKNYQAVCQNHTWSRRWLDMRLLIDSVETRE